jgi:hypothetical protein
MFRQPDGSLSSSHQNVLSQIPMTFDTTLAKFHLTEKTVVYVVCSSCHCTYSSHYAYSSTVPLYPEHCTHCPTPEAKYGEPLLSHGPEGVLQLQKTFMYHNFKDYLASLLSHADIEVEMDQACNNLQDLINSPHPPLIKHAFEVQFLCQFCSPEPGSLFIDRGDKGCYMFALHVDFFNMEGMSICGASKSSGIISMACLNLPLDIRYKLENMYLAGIILGPKQPSLEHLNHYIWPLINDMVDSWEHSIKFSKTACFPTSWLIHSAIALAVCDLPATHHLASLAGIISHFYCSACNCLHKTTYSRVDFEKWESHNKDELQKFAEQWMDAATTSKQEKLFKAHGVHYSEMWHLSYWKV